MAEAKTVGELLEQAQQLDSDIVVKLRHPSYGENYSSRESLLAARETLAETINELIKAL